MAIDWSEICEKYKGLWVGLKDDEQTVIASGESVRAVMAEAEQKGFPKPILFRVPTKVIPYVGFF